MKELILWPPSQTPNLYPGEGAAQIFSTVDVCATDRCDLGVDPVRFPQFAAALRHAVHVQLQAGDALYMPVYWWHLVRSPLAQISMSMSYWRQHEISQDDVSFT